MPTGFHLVKTEELHLVPDGHRHPLRVCLTPENRRAALWKGPWGTRRTVFAEREVRLPFSTESRGAPASLRAHIENMGHKFLVAASMDNDDIV
jgi:hypothetical protein